MNLPDKSLLKTHLQNLTNLMEDEMRSGRQVNCPFIYSTFTGLHPAPHVILFEEVVQGGTWLPCLPCPLTQCRPRLLEMESQTRG